MDNFTKTIERIAFFVDKKGISLNKFSQQLGVSNSYFSKMIKNRASVGSDIIENILRLYPELNTNWLLTGAGEMLNSDEGWGNLNSGDQPQPGPCQQCAIRDKLIAKQEENIDLLKDKIAELNRQLRDKGKSDNIKQTA